MKNRPEQFKKVLAQAKRPLSDAAAVNATRTSYGLNYSLPVSLTPI